MNTTPQDKIKRQALQASVFGRLDDRQLDEIAGLSDLHQVRSGEVLCAQGDFSQAAFVIAVGEVTVVAGGVEVAHCGPGDLVGDWALFTSGHRSATLRAVTDVEVVVVDPREIDSLLMAEPAAAGLVGPQLAR